MNQQLLKKRSVRIIAIVLAIVTLLPIIVRAGIDVVAATYEVWSPDYDMVDISSVLDKDLLTDADYDLLFEQTGLTKIGIDDMLAKGQKNQILKIQREFFAEPSFTCSKFHFCVGMFVKSRGTYPHVPLQDGDIIYSPSTYISFINISHAAIAVSGGNFVVEAYGYGNPTQYSSTGSFFIYPEFVVLRPKAGKEAGEMAARYVEENMLDVPYDILTGILGKKAPEKLKTTHCSHLPWYAYYMTGIDVDSNGGKIVTPKDILNSDELEIVQVFGMDVSEFK